MEEAAQMKGDLSKTKEASQNPLDRMMRDEARRLRRMMANEDPRLAALKTKGKRFKKSLEERSQAVVEYNPDGAKGEAGSSNTKIQFTNEDTITTDYEAQRQKDSINKREVLLALLKKLDIV